MVKTTLLSTRKVLIFRVFAFLFYIGITFLVVISYARSLDNIILVLPLASLYGWISFKELKKVWQLKSVSYDSYYLYVKLDGYEQQIPYEDILSIELKSITGIHEILLSNRHGKRKIYFKASLWYPFNFNKIDGKVWELNNKIRNSKSRPIDLSRSLEPKEIKLN